MVVVDMLDRILDSLSEALSKNIYGYLYMCLWIFPKQAQRGGVLTCFLIPQTRLLVVRIVEKHRLFPKHSVAAEGFLLVETRIVNRRFARSAC